MLEERIIAFFASLQKLFDDGKNIGAFYSSVHFLVASIISIFAIVFFVHKVESTDDLISSISDRKKLWKKENRSGYLLYLLRYSVLTGVLAAAVVAVKNRCLDIPTAIALAIIGPYVIRDSLVSSYIQKNFDFARKQITTAADNVEVKYQEKLDQIRKEIASK